MSFAKTRGANTAIAFVPVARSKTPHAAFLLATAAASLPAASGGCTEEEAPSVNELDTADIAAMVTTTGTDATIPTNATSDAPSFTSFSALPCSLAASGLGSLLFVLSSTDTLRDAVQLPCNVALPPRGSQGETDEQKLGRLDKELGAAMRKLGWQNVESTGIVANHSIAIAGSLFRQASAFGDADASNNWAVCLAEGAAASRDEAAAVKLFCHASKCAASASAAYNNLGKCAALAMGGIESDPKSAFGLFEIARALHRDNWAAAFNLAMCLREGLGCPRNKVRCFELLTEAACAHETKPTAISTLCLNQLGICHRDGVGTPKNLTAAFALFTRAAQDGCAEAMNNAGVCCRDAVGTHKDNASARTWFRRASEGGSRLGVRNLAML